MAPPRIQLVVDLTTAFGRVVAALRNALHLTQTDMSDDLGWPRGVLARVETGRNTANIDNIVELEDFFIARELIHRRGELTELTCGIVRELQDRGHRAIYGNQPKPDGDDPIDAPGLDRIVGTYVDNWLRDLKRPTKRKAR